MKKTSNYSFIILGQDNCYSSFAPFLQLPLRPSNLMKIVCFPRLESKMERERESKKELLKRENCFKGLFPTSFYPLMTFCFYYQFKPIFHYLIQRQSLTYQKNETYITLRKNRRKDKDQELKERGKTQIEEENAFINNLKNSWTLLVLFLLLCPSYVLVVIIPRNQRWTNYYFLDQFGHQWSVC